MTRQTPHYFVKHQTEQIERHLRTSKHGSVVKDRTEQLERTRRCTSTAVGQRRNSHQNTHNLARYAP
jgi:hypothetical protein